MRCLFTRCPLTLYELLDQLPNRCQATFGSLNCFSLAAGLTLNLAILAADSTLRPLLASSPQIAAVELAPIRPKTVCPDRLEVLMPLLLRDLPSYANRVSQRAYIKQYRLTAEVPGYVLLAGHPEYEPLPLPAGEYTPETAINNVLQSFFTTLERQYFSDQAFQLQHYHWLFLTQTESGWRFVLMLSTIGNYPSGEPPTPPEDSSEGVIAQAIRLWLRDCETGNIASP